MLVVVSGEDVALPPDGPMEGDRVGWMMTVRVDVDVRPDWSVAT